MKRLLAKGRDPGAWGIGLVVIHLVVNVVHGMAHGRLGIELNLVQEFFVAVVILAAPIVAAFLLWGGKRKAGSALLAVSMAGALAFGIYFHFIAPGPDNVHHEWAGPPKVAAHRVFEETAVELASLQLIGMVLGLVMFFRSEN